MKTDDEKTDDPPKMTYHGDSLMNMLSIKFDEIMLYPPSLREYTSTNEGIEVFEVQYFPSQQTIDYLYENGIEQKLFWSVGKADP